MLEEILSKANARIFLVTICFGVVALCSLLGVGWWYQPSEEFWLQPSTLRGEARITTGVRTGSTRSWIDDQEIFCQTSVFYGASYCSISPEARGKRVTAEILRITLISGSVIIPLSIRTEESVPAFKWGRSISEWRSAIWKFTIATSIEIAFYLSALFGFICFIFFSSKKE
jgi:hypothetical protein